MATIVLIMIVRFVTDIRIIKKSEKERWDTCILVWPFFPLPPSSAPISVSLSFCLPHSSAPIYYPLQYKTAGRRRLPREAEQVWRRCLPWEALQYPKWE